jgi:hemerythrin-like domain-containing protein
MHKEFFNLLRKDHKEVKDILEELKEMKGKPSQKEKLFKKLKEEIKPHMKAEEHVFYPALQDNKDTREDALEGIEEHHVAEIVLNELEKLSTKEDQWAAKLSVLKELVEHHIEEEESKIFDDAEEALSEDEMKKIMKKFEEEKEKVKSSMS